MSEPNPGRQIVAAHVLLSRRGCARNAQHRHRHSLSPDAKATTGESQSAKVAQAPSIERAVNRGASGTEQHNLGLAKEVDSQRPQTIPEPIKAQGAAHENFTGFDCRRQFKNGNDLQLASVEHPFVVNMVMHEGMPLTRQRIGRHFVDG